MADFCKQCSIKFFGKDFRELAGFTTKADDEAGLFMEVICEGCGFVMVNSEGECQGGKSCLDDHVSTASTGDSVD